MIKVNQENTKELYDTGEIIAIRSLWDGKSLTREDSPLFFDKVAKVFEEAHINETLGRKGGVR